MIYYNKIRKMDISNGPGVRVSVFFQGCPFHCEGCFNPETWDYDTGKEFTDETIKEILDLCEPDYIEGLSLLGGEPIFGRNIEGSTKLAKAFKERFPNKTLWSWSGSTYEKLKDLEIFDYLDVLVDGQFILKERNPKLIYCGSNNQRTVDIKKTRESGKIIPYEGDER